MWCCASKPEVKKPLRSAKQQPLAKVVLNLSESIRLQYKNKWQGKIESNKTNQEKKEQKNQAKSQDLLQITELKKKIQVLKKKKRKIQQTLKAEQRKGKETQEKLSKAETIATVLNYMILKKEQEIDSFALKIKA